MVIMPLQEAANAATQLIRVAANMFNGTRAIGVLQHIQRGWQCRYYGGALDDKSLDLATFDYADGGTSMQVSMDVSSHNANPNYAPNLTETY